MTTSMHDSINTARPDQLHGVPKDRHPDHEPRRGDGRTCLVAVDGSAASVHALVWGFRYATSHGMCVEVLTVWPTHRSVLIHEVPGHVNAARWSARTAQADVIRQALEEVLDQPITAARLENAALRSAIVHASARCDLVVLGSNSNDSSHSLTERVLDEAACEVGGRRVVRPGHHDHPIDAHAPPPDPPDPDDSPASEPADDSGSWWPLDRGVVGTGGLGCLARGPRSGCS